MRPWLRAGIVAWAAFAAGARASNILVPFTVEAWASPDGTSPRTVGLPIPPARAIHVSQLRLLRRGTMVPAQFEPMATWPDGSLRWVVADFSAEVPGSLDNYALTQDSFVPQPAPARPVTVIAGPAEIRVDTGAAIFVVPTTGFLPFSSVEIAGVPLLAPGGTELAITQGGTTFRASADAGTTWTIERAGPLRATLLAAGTFRDGSGTALLAHRTRLHFFAGESLVKVETALQNSAAAIHPGNVWDLGSSGSRLFDDLTLMIPLAGAGPRTWTTWPEGTPVAAVLGGEATLYQESSGGNRWNWATHVNRNGVVPMTFRGWQLRVDGPSVASGDRASGLLDLSSAAGGVAAGLPAFWEEFPKALRARAPGTLEIGFFPTEFPDQHELQGGEEKTHEAWLHFHAGDAAAALPRETLEELMLPRQPGIDPDEVWESFGAGFFGRGCTGCAPYFDTIQYMAFDQGVRSFFTQREEIDEYGWRNYGEAFADHETDCGTQCWDCPISHDNNQYDTAWAALMNWLRTRSRPWFLLGDQAVRHLRDIDVYHTDGDVDAYDRGMFWHTTHDTNAFTSTHRTYSALMSSACTPYLSGGPALGHLYTDGLLLHGWLTGDRRSLEVHEELERYLATRYALDGPAPGAGYEPRAWANALRTAVAGCRRDWTSGNCALADRIVEDSDARVNPALTGASFQDSMLMVSLGRYLDMKREQAALASPEAVRAFASLQELARRVRDGFAPQQDVLDFRYAEGLWYAYLHAPQGDPEKASWSALARAYFDAGQQASFFNTYITNKGLAHVAGTAQLASWLESPVPGPVRDLRVRKAPAGTDVLLTWTPVTTDVHGNALAVRYRVHSAGERPTRFGRFVGPFTFTTTDVPASPVDVLTFFDVRAVGDLEGE